MLISLLFLIFWDNFKKENNKAVYLISKIAFDIVYNDTLYVL